MNTDLRISVKDKSAKMNIPFGKWTLETKEDRSVLVAALEKLDGIFMEVSENTVEAGLDFDFGKLIPESLWNSVKKDYFQDDGLQEYFAGIVIRAAVKELYPSVVEGMRKALSKKGIE